MFSERRHSERRSAMQRSIYVRQESRLGPLSRPNCGTIGRDNGPILRSTCFTNSFHHTGSSRSQLWKGPQRHRTTDGTFYEQRIDQAARPAPFILPLSMSCDPLPAHTPIQLTLRYMSKRSPGMRADDLLQKLPGSNGHRPPRLTDFVGRLHNPGVVLRIFEPLRTDLHLSQPNVQSVASHLCRQSLPHVQVEACLLPRFFDQRTVFKASFKNLNQLIRIMQYHRQYFLRLSRVRANRIV
jgi:hypothetical protein